MHKKILLLFSLLLIFTCPVFANSTAIVDYRQESTWGGDGSGEHFAKFNVFINSNEDVSDWKVIIEFENDTNLSQLWNGRSNLDSKILTVTPEEYNNIISAGSNEGFGFIVSSPTQTPTISHIELILDDKVADEITNNTTSNNTSEHVDETEKPNNDNIQNESNDIVTANNTYLERLIINFSIVFNNVKERFSTVSAPVDTTPTTPVATGGGTPLDTHGKLNVKGTQIVDKNGDVFIIKGVSTHGIAWFPQYIDKDGFKTMRDNWGVNTIRLALYSGSNEGYTPAMHQKVHEGVKYATELGMYVIIDWHVLGNGNPNTDKANAITFFKEMTEEYKGYDNIIYEICNEPNGNVTWANDIKPYSNELIGIIRQKDNDAIVIVGTPTWSQDVDIVANDPLTGHSNIVYALHFYAATHTDGLRTKLTTALDKGLPVLVSEFGICDASGNGNIDEGQADKWIDLLNSKGIGYVCWNLSNKNEASALINSNCDKTSGWTEDELSQQGKWLIKAYNE